MKLIKKRLVEIFNKHNLESTQGLHKALEPKTIQAEELLPSMAPRDQLPNESSDTSETDEDKNQSSMRIKPCLAPISCPMKHEGKMLLNEVFPIAIDELFTLLFSVNQFNIDLMDAMKYTDVKVSNWEQNSETGLKTRINQLVVPVSQPVGPKTCQVTETQVIQPCTTSGERYVLEVETVNAGVPYCDSFYITHHICLTRVSISETNYTVYGQIKYRKSVWGFVKNFIEKNVWAGLDDYIKALKKALDEESKKQSESGVEVTRIQNQENTQVTSSVSQPEPVPPVIIPTITPVSPSNNTVLWAILGVLISLLLLNVILYYKLSVLEGFDKEFRVSSTIDTQIFGEERSHEEWVSLLQQQAIQHQKEIQQWKIALKSVVSLLKQAEESITDLQHNIQSVVSERIMSTLKYHSDSDGISVTNKHNEL